MTELVHEERNNRKLLQAMVDGTSDLVYAKDLEGRYLLINSEAARLYGQPAQEILGRDDSALFPDEVVQVLRENDHQVIASAGNSTVQEMLVDADGKPRTFLSTRGPLFDEAGNVSGIFSISRDVTGQVQAQEALLAHQEQLRALAIELSRAEEKERRRIAAELHDEIGQNLALAKMKLGNCFQEVTLPPDAALAVRELEGILARTIQEVRSLTFQISPPLLYEVGFEAAVEWLAEQFEAKHGLRVRIECDPSSPPLYEELSSALYQVVRELLVNVVKHARAGEVFITVKREAGRIEVTVRDDGNGFRVSPEGAGKEMRGFGLFNIRQRVQHLCGALEVKSGEGGTTVAVSVPLAADSAAS